MQRGQDDFQCTEMLEFRMRVHRDAAAVVAHRQPVVRFQRHLDEAGVASHRLVHRVVQQLRRQMVQRGLVSATDIHAGAAPDRLQPFQNLDVLGRVALRPLAAEQIVHAVFSPLRRHPTRRRGVPATVAAFRNILIEINAGGRPGLHYAAHGAQPDTADPRPDRPVARARSPCRGRPSGPSVVAARGGARPAVRAARGLRDHPDGGRSDRSRYPDDDRGVAPGSRKPAASVGSRQGGTMMAVSRRLFLSGAGDLAKGECTVATRRAANLAILSAAALAMAPGFAAAQAQQSIALPPPRADFGTSLAQALKLRRSIRAFDPRPLAPQVLSELLWAAYGVNRPATADRTAPSWRHARETDVYAAMADGVWRYDPIKHVLVPHLAGDVRAQTGVQDFVGTAPLNLVYVSNAEHMSGVPREEQHRVAAADIGFIGQNVYLYCASEGLACVFRASLDTARLARTLGLAETQFIMFSQTVGFPKA